MPGTAKQHTRAGSRRPIEAAEITHLEALGARLAAGRRSRRLSQSALAADAELSVSTVQRIEAGTRRTRRTTLERIAAALGDPELADELPRLAGPALAPESTYAERIARRRQRRHRRGRGRQEWAARREQRREVAGTLRALSRFLREQEAELAELRRFGGY
jgi:transcriptional regulator with XRE-family HTH domain